MTTRDSRAGQLPRARLIRRAALLVLAIALLPPALFATHRRVTGNFGTVIPGRLYRSAQINAETLERFIDQHAIRTVINLRGPNPNQEWYDRELRASLKAGATHVDIPLASDQWLSRDQARSLLEILDRCEYPALIHCEFGAERTGLVAALATLLEPGRSLEDGYGQFSLYHLFVPIQDGKVMIGHLDAYASWLRAEGRPHTPERLRAWLLHVYVPGSPSREHWPCNPYPLMVTVVPSPSGQVSRREDWPSNACPKTVATGSAPRDWR